MTRLSHADAWNGDESAELWDRGDAAALVTLVRVEGSSYRRPGARLLIAANGDYAGSNLRRLPGSGSRPQSAVDGARWAQSWSATPLSSMTPRKFPTAWVAAAPSNCSSSLHRHPECALHGCA